MMKFIATTSDKINDVSVASGQLIFSRDDRVIYLDSDIGRTEYRAIISLATEYARSHLVSPVGAFYFVEETAVLWKYDKVTGWRQLTSTPDERLSYYPDGLLPIQGREGILYYTPDGIYQWRDYDQDYVEMGVDTWGPIE